MTVINVAFQRESNGFVDEKVSARNPPAQSLPAEGLPSPLYSLRVRVYVLCMYVSVRWGALHWWIWRGLKM